MATEAAGTERPWPWPPGEVHEMLRKVMDPEVGVNIVDLGLIHDVLVHPEQGVRVRMTMTSAACPMSEMLLDDIDRVLQRALPPDTPVEVELVWEPPWTPARMSAEARELLGWEDATP